MLARTAAIGLAGLVLTVAIAVAMAAAPAPDGPRLAVMKLTSRPAAFELATLGPAGGDYRRVLAGSPLQGRGSDDLGGFAWSPDGAMLAFSHHGRKGRMISVVPASGGSPQVVPGTNGGNFPVFSPDGRSLAFSRSRAKRTGKFHSPAYRSESIWIIDLVSGVRQQLTRWRNELWQYPSSFSPDGSTLLLNRVDYRRSVDAEVVALRFDGRTSGLLVGEGSYPSYSPDGSKIALFREIEHRLKNLPRDRDVPQELRSSRWRTNMELYVVNADGSRLRRLTHTPHKDELFASWDPSGERIAYSQFRRGRFESPNSIMQINADGTCPTKVLSRTGAIFYAPAWQPGPGREAGRIAC